jgi:predicted nuclease of predicted toxin-antitoxin system
VKLWFDEDLSPTLVSIANQRGFEAACNRDRGLLGATDAHLRAVVQAEGFVLVTDNASDFRPMFVRETIHPGLAVVPAEHGRARQQRLAGELIAFIVAAAEEAGETPADFMINRLVEIDDRGVAVTRELPPHA